MASKALRKLWEKYMTSSSMNSFGPETLNKRLRKEVVFLGQDGLG
jgi:hypothetical protein